MKHPSPSAALLGAALLFTAHAASAHDGHDHGALNAAPASEARPRFAAVSETFELVGVLDGQRITLYLDRYADNRPVRDAQIELDVAGTAYRATRQGDDAYAVVLGAVPAPGVLPVTATVTAGAESDLLAGELDLHRDAPADAATHTPARREIGAAVGGGLAALALAAWLARRVKGRRHVRAGGAA